MTRLGRLGITGLLLCPNKTLQGIYADWVWPPGAQVSRRAMHEAVFAAGWDSEGLMPWHRWILTSDYRSRQRTVLSLDWTLSHHERGEKIFGVKRAYDYVQRKMSRYQTVMTRVVANSQHFDGVRVEVQLPNFEKEERAYLEMTAQPEYTYTQMEQI